MVHRIDSCVGAGEDGEGAPLDAGDIEHQEGDVGNVEIPLPQDIDDAGGEHDQYQNVAKDEYDSGFMSDEKE